ncbi:uncharacterized protein LOC143452553 [Clavelina lepadiformis]|uniref:Uncharacterized protein n=1 Tax=Clavelina lepadiformis TaxID=159417 RepID=A0ABP0GJF2_CLALP
MNWNQFCNDVLRRPGRSVEYVYLGTMMGKLGENKNNPEFPELTVGEFNIIHNANSLNFGFRGHQYSLAQRNNGVVTYQGPTRAIAFAKSFTCIIIVISCRSPARGMVVKQCHRAASYGKSRLIDMRC